MSNLGSPDTPVEGESFSLPAGAEMAEDNGDLVVKDSSGSIVFRRNETADEWQLEGTDLTGIGSLGTDELRGGWDRLITSTSELESLPADITAGETVGIAQLDTPYRPTSWSSGGKYAEIDVSNVTIIGESQFAASGEPLIKPADGSDIGGLMFGLNSAVTDIAVRGVGFDGNKDNMDQSVERLHGVTFDTVNRGAVARCFIQFTSPYHEHSTGGSPVTFRDGATACKAVGNRIREPGDRCIQVAGNGHIIGWNALTDGFDRGVSFNVNEPSGGRGETAADATTVVGNYVRDLREGSAYAHSGAVTGRLNTVVGNAAEGTYRGVVQLTTTKDSVAVGNVGYHAAGVNSEQAGLEVGSERNYCVGNVVYDPDGGHPAMAEIQGEKCEISRNTLYSGGGSTGILVFPKSRNSKVSSNLVEGAVDGIVGRGVKTDFKNNHVFEYGDGAGNGYGIDVRENGYEKTVAGNRVDTSKTNAAGIRINNNGAEVRNNKLTQKATWDIAAVPKHLFDNSPEPFVSSVPENNYEGAKYPDDGTNTGTGTKGYRVYLGGSWVDWITA
jgi:hypothetical protein